MEDSGEDPSDGCVPLDRPVSVYGPQWVCRTRYWMDTPRLEARANPSPHERIGSFRPGSVVAATPLIAPKGRRFESRPRYKQRTGPDCGDAGQALLLCVDSCSSPDAADRAMTHVTPPGADRSSRASVHWKSSVPRGEPMATTGTIPWGPRPQGGLQAHDAAAPRRLPAADQPPVDVAGAPRPRREGRPGDRGRRDPVRPDRTATGQSAARSPDEPEHINSGAAP